MHKVGGKTGIATAMVVYSSAVLWDGLLELMQDMWRRGEVIAEWKDAEVVPIPKKGTFTLVIIGGALACWMW